MSRKFTALVVDDYEQNRHIFDQVLQDAGYNVLLAEDGQEGLEILKQISVDLVMLDLQMPRVDGTTFLHFVRSRPIFRHLKVIVITANPQVVTERVDRLADYVMYKPVNIEEMTNFVRRIKKTLPA